ncbi:MAG: NTP/NDP exchange transporter [Holosporales bacterium]|jgi:AAA family ATP:ADP antiporter|nr:NTP/NDP exchange transporter [Holosporales bacterium]
MSNDGKPGGGSVNPEFSGLRALVWPVHRYELKKFLPTGLMMLCILFIYTLVRDLKDTLVVSRAVGGGAEVLGFLKLYLVMPAAILFMIVFVKLANMFDREKLFYVIVLFFLSFFVAFGFILYPMADYLHMSRETIAGLQQSVPRLYWVWPVIGNWSYSLFYIIAELWGSVVLSALFWQFANEITKVKEAKRFYSLFGFVGNFGLIASGSVIIVCANIAKKSAALGAPDAFGSNLRYQMLAVAAFGGALLYIYRWMHKHVLTDPKLYTPGEGVKKKKKLNLGFIKSFKYILTSKYLLMIALLIFAYGVSINLVECIFKGQINLQYPDPNDYNSLMGKLSLTTGILTIVVMLVGTNILRIFSWKVAALVTPVFLLATSIIFFGMIMYEKHVGIQATIMGTTVLFMAVVVGLAQNAFAKGVKYSLFDSTKQMAYIPLGQEMKVKGQAAVEIIAGRGGKSGGAIIQSTLLLIIGGNVSLASKVEILGSIVLVVVLFWISAVFSLSKQFEVLSAEKEAAEEAAAKEARDQRKEMPAETEK